MTLLLALTAVGFLYEVPMIAKNGGRTLCKLVARIKVVREADGDAPSWRSSAIRWAIPAALGLIPLLGPILWLLAYVSLTWDGGRQGWHDERAGTLVIKREKPEPTRPQST